MAATTFARAVIPCIVLALVPTRAGAGEAPWNEFTLQLDENAGVFDLPRMVAPGKEEPGWLGTNNVTLSLLLQPKAMAWGQVGMLFRGGVWIRTADFDATYSTSVMRPHVGLALWARPADTPVHRVQITLNPGYYYGIGLNQPKAKSREFHEFALYTALSYTYRPWALTVDVHNWYVNGLDLTLAGVPGREEGVIFGTTVGWRPLAGSGIPVVETLEPYVRFREWGWTVGPASASLDRKWWNEVTFGFRFGYDFSIFE